MGDLLWSTLSVFVHLWLNLTGFWINHDCSDFATMWKRGSEFSCVAFMSGYTHHTPPACLPLGCTKKTEIMFMKRFLCKCEYQSVARLRLGVEACWSWHTGLDPWSFGVIIKHTPLIPSRLYTLVLCGFALLWCVYQHLSDLRHCGSWTRCRT